MKPFGSTRRPRKGKRVATGKYRPTRLDTAVSLPWRARLQRGARALPGRLRRALAAKRRSWEQQARQTYKLEDLEHIVTLRRLPRNRRNLAGMRVRRDLPWYGAALAAVILLSCSFASSMTSARAYAYTGDDACQLRMVFVGDMMLGRNIKSLGEASGYETLFTAVSSFWSASDLVFANLETAVLQGDVSEYEEAEKDIHIWTGYEALESAMDAGVNVWACANNHVFDYGAQAVEELAAYLEASGAAYAGIGASLEDAATCQIIEQEGIEVAFISITDVYYGYSAAAEVQAGALTTAYTDYNMLVYQAAQRADITVVYIHWGGENEISVNERQVELGHQLADAGADIIIGSHPHVVQEVELYGDSIIFYSLGNFIFDQGNTYARDSVMVEYTVETDGTGWFRLYTVRIEDGVPFVTTNWFYQTRIARELSQGLAQDSYHLDEDGFLVIPFDILGADSEVYQA